eukprot:274737_1
MLLLFITTVLLCIVQSSDLFCAWNRAFKPADENLGKTYNFINGEYNRWYAFYTGVLWHGQPYYRMELTDCWVSNLFLYRYQDSMGFPPTFTWVIAPNMGVPPRTGYAYCTDTGDQPTPHGVCDGKWAIGAAGTDEHVEDSYFKVQAGGCPQATCASMVYDDKFHDDWAGTYTWFQPNIYIQTDSATSTTGVWYLFFQPGVWKWAIHETIAKYDQCELYKHGKGFTSVSNIIDGDAKYSLDPTDGVISYTPNTGDSRAVMCSGTHPTPAPTDAVSWVPTKGPTGLGKSICDITWTAIADSYWTTFLGICGCTPHFESIGKCTNSPTIGNPVFTNAPTNAPNDAATPSSPDPTAHPASSPVNPAYLPTPQPASSPVDPTTAAPTSPGTAKPTTAAPTNTDGTARPTGPTTASPTSPGTARPTT